MIGVCTERRGWGEPGREGPCVPFIAQLNRKSLLMERHLQGISPPLQRVGRNVEKMCASENRDGEQGGTGEKGERSTDGGIKNRGADQPFRGGSQGAVILRVLLVRQPVWFKVKYHHLCHTDCLEMLGS